MTTSALVLTLTADEALRLRCLAQLDDHDDLELGPAEGRRLPVVLTTSDAESSERAARALTQLPGVDHLDIVFVGLADGDAPRTPDAAASGAGRAAPPAAPTLEKPAP